MKRIRPAPMGRAYHYVRRISHLEIVLAEKNRNGAAGRTHTAGGKAAKAAAPQAESESQGQGAGEEESGWQEGDGKEVETSFDVESFAKSGCRATSDARRLRSKSLGATMGQKVHPYGFRLGYTKPWKSRWFVEKDYDKLLLEDHKLKAELKDKLKSAGVSSVEIERPGNKLRIIIKTARPGIIIGRKGAEIDKLKQELQKRRRARCMSTFRKCTSRNWMRNWCRNRLRCNWKSAWASGAPCASRWIRRCVSAAKESRFA